MIIKIAIVDDHKLFRKSFELLLGQIGEVEVVCKCSNGIELLEALKTKTIDVVFLDIQMPELNGYQTAAILTKQYPKVKILVLTSFNDVYSLSRMLDFNIAGYLTKNTKLKDLKNAILTVKESGVYFSKEVAMTLKELESKVKYQFVNLSEREIELIKLFAKQYNGREVASRLGISFRTVEKHKEFLMQRTESFNFIGVIIYAFLTHYISERDFERDH